MKVDFSNLDKLLGDLSKSGGTGGSLVPTSVNLKSVSGVLASNAKKKPTTKSTGLPDYSKILKSGGTSKIKTTKTVLSKVLNAKPVSRTLNTLAGLGGFVPNMLAELTDKKKSTNGFSSYGKNIVKGVTGAYTRAYRKNGIKGILGAAAGDLATGGLSAISRGLAKAGKNAKTTADVMSNLGWKQQAGDAKKGWNPLVARKGQLDYYDIIGFAGDVALDPTTYLTLGGSSAIKAGAAAAKKAAKQAAKDAGVSTTKGLLKGKAFEDVATKTSKAIETNAYTKAIKSGVSEVDAVALAKKAAADAENAIIDAGKAARFKAQNALVSIDVPFTKITKQFGQKTGFLKKVDAKIDVTGAQQITTALKNLGVQDDNSIKAVIKEKYGVDRLEDMTSQMKANFDELMVNINSNVANEVITTLRNSGVPEDMVADIATLMKSKQGLVGLSPKEISSAVMRLTNKITPSENAELIRALNDSLPDEFKGGLDGILDFRQAKSFKREEIIQSLTSKGVKMADAKAQAKEIMKQADASYKELRAVKNAELKKTATLIRTTASDYMDQWMSIFGKENPKINELNSKIKELTSKTIPDLQDELNNITPEMISKNGGNAKAVEDFNAFKAGLPTVVTKSQFDQLAKMAKDVLDINLTATPSAMKDLQSLKGSLENLSDQFKLLSAYGLTKKQSTVTIKLFSKGENIKGFSAGTLADFSPSSSTIRLRQGQELSFMHEYMHYLDTYMSDVTAKGLLGGLTSKGYTFDVYKNKDSFRVKYDDKHPLKQVIDTAIADLKKQGKYVDVKTYKARGVNNNDIYYYSGQEIIARLFSNAIGNSTFLKNIDQNVIDAMKNLSRNDASYNDIYSQKVLDDMTEKLFKAFDDAGIKYNAKATKEELEKLRIAVQSKIDEAIFQADAMSNKVLSIEKAQAMIRYEMLHERKFVQDMGGKSKLGSYLSDRVFRFANPRTLGLTGQGSAYLNSMADIIRDSEGTLRGGFAKMQNDMAIIKRMSKGLPQEDLDIIPYLLEGKAPQNMDLGELLKNAKKPEQLQKVTAKFREIFEDMAAREIEVGALTTFRKGYLPHVIRTSKVTDEMQKAISNSPLFKKVFGRNSSNKFNKSRTSFPTLADWENSMLRLREEVKQITDPTDLAEAQKQLDALEKLYERNIFSIMEDRYTEYVRSYAMTDMYRKFENSGVIIRKGKQGFATDLENFVEIDETTAKKLGYLKKGDLIQKDVLGGLEKLGTLFTDQGFQKFMDNVTAGTNILKSLLTTYIPRHYVYNILGAAANNVMAGVTPLSYNKAGKLLNKLKFDKMDAVEKKFIQEAIDDGILSAGSSIDVADPFRLARLENAKDSGEASKLTSGLMKWEQKVTDNRYAHTMRRIGELTDNVSRLAHYIELRKTTGSRKLARDSVRKYLYNYGEVTNADKYIKLAIPFWTWTKNNIPRQMIEFAAQPRYFATYDKFQELLNNEEENKYIPEYLKSPLGALRVGQNAYWNPRLPMQDLANIQSPKEAGESLINMLTPPAKSIFEVGANYQYFNKSAIDPFKSKTGDYDSKKLREYYISQTGVGNEIMKLFSPEVRGANTSVLEQIRASVVGKTTEVEKDKELRRIRYEMRDQINKQKARIKADRRKKMELEANKNE